MSYTICTIYLSTISDTYFYSHFFKKLSHLSKKVFSTEKKVISQKKRLSQDEEKVFSEKKLFYFFENTHLKKKKRNAFLPTLFTQQNCAILAIVSRSKKNLFVFGRKLKCLANYFPFFGDVRARKISFDIFPPLFPPLLILFAEFQN